MSGYLVPATAINRPVGVAPNNGTNFSHSYATGTAAAFTFQTSRVRGKDASSGVLTDRDTAVDAGQYSAIDLDSRGYPVIAYMDSTTSNFKLKIAYATKSIPVAGADWKMQELTATQAGDYAGEFVTMRIDSTDRIHIAFHRSSTNELIYLRGVRNGDNGYTFADSPVVVDNSGAVGRWADISLDVNRNPWISYQDNSKAQSGAYDGVKIAYLPDAGMGDGTLWKTASNWETMHVPARYRTSNNRVHIEAAPSGAVTPNNFWSAAVGYESNDFFRIAYLVK
jgi:hypothetical protein